MKLRNNTKKKEIRPKVQKCVKTDLPGTSKKKKFQIRLIGSYPFLMSGWLLMYSGGGRIIIFRLYPLVDPPGFRK